MPEYTISTQSGVDWPALPPGKLSSHHLTPPHLDCEIVEDGSVLVLRIGVATVSVSWELLGTWCVGIEGSETPEWADSVASGNRTAAREGHECRCRLVPSQLTQMPPPDIGG
ncbi:hypothetical protein [Streptomyces bobili]|uniref:Uncharacterized protein n=1 Tax=Streptomyces bobili TaxID=67280 RepID=A0ABZ1QPS3_9ACTN|nr:hypothetical protein [Streptomyces bobili]